MARTYLEQLKIDIDLFLKVSEDLVDEEEDLLGDIAMQRNVMEFFYDQVCNYHEEGITK